MRILILFVQIVIIISFGYRVILDRQSNDLKEEIEQKERILMVYQDSEAELRDAQAKLNDLVKLSSNIFIYENVWVDLFSKLPDFKKMNITIAKGKSFEISIVSTPSNIQEIERMLKESKYTKM